MPSRPCPSCHEAGAGRDISRLRDNTYLLCCRRCGARFEFSDAPPPVKIDRDAPPPIDLRGPSRRRDLL